MQRTTGPRDDIPRIRLPDYAQEVAEFPGPVLVASAPPPGTRVICHSERHDSHLWAMRVTYARFARDHLEIRTVRGSLDWTPAFESPEDFRTMMDYRGRGEEAETPFTVTVDGEPVEGVRIDVREVSGVHSGVHLKCLGQLVFCFGDKSVIDTMELRTGTPADFAEFQAAIETHLAEVRAARQLGS